MTPCDAASPSDDTQHRSILAPTAIETEHVHKVYDSIAPHFSHTRHHPWPLVTAYLQNLEAGSLVADVGCGNGKYLRINPSIVMIGSDRSIPLLICSSVRSNEYVRFTVSSDLPIGIGPFIPTLLRVAPSICSAAMH